MKTRNGFVSNSSSSSFTCDVCGHNESGYDLSLNEAEMIECNEGHIFCENHIDEYMIENFKNEDDEEWRYELDVKYCPVCTLKNISADNILSYLINKYNLNYDDIENEIREKFSDLKELKKYIARNPDEK